MKVSTFFSKITDIPKIESYNDMTDEEREKYLELKAKVKEINSFDIEYSRLFENRKITGNIALSIDPIDYLLMSTNRSGWHSCYAISKEGQSRYFGEYVSGLFSYMCDPSTIVTYRHSDEMAEYKIGNSKFTEYSKNWRQLIYLDLNNYGFACSRQYPFHDDNLSKTVRGFLEDVLSENLGVENKWKFKRITDSSKLKRLIRQVTFNYDRLAYNDILHRDEGLFVYNAMMNNFSNLQFNVDSNPICPVCGENTIYRSGIPMCDDCKRKVMS
jgi:hypothetical protein